MDLALHFENLAWSATTKSWRRRIRHHLAMSLTCWLQIVLVVLLLICFMFGIWNSLGLCCHGALLAFVRTDGRIAWACFSSSKMGFYTKKSSNSTCWKGALIEKHSEKRKRQVNYLKQYTLHDKNLWKVMSRMSFGDCDHSDRALLGGSGTASHCLRHSPSGLKRPQSLRWRWTCSYEMNERTWQKHEY